MAGPSRLDNLPGCQWAAPRSARRGADRAPGCPPGWDRQAGRGSTRCVTRSSQQPLDAGVPLRNVQEAASHADPHTTMRYDRARTATPPTLSPPMSELPGSRQVDHPTGHALARMANIQSISLIVTSKALATRRSACPALLEVLVGASHADQVDLHGGRGAGRCVAYRRDWGVGGADARFAVAGHQRGFARAGSLGLGRRR